MRKWAWGERDCTNITRKANKFTHSKLLPRNIYMGNGQNGEVKGLKLLGAAWLYVHWYILFTHIEIMILREEKELIVNWGNEESFASFSSPPCIDRDLIWIWNFLKNK